MENKTKALIAIVIICGAFGLTFGYFYVTKSDSLNPIILLLLRSAPPPSEKIWTWVSGNYSKNNLGNYGVKGIAADSNIPGARKASTSWVDSNGNFWLFGGYGYDNVSTFANYLNDLWKFNGTHWTWVSGNYSQNSLSNYGIKGFPAASNVPGARHDSVSWIDLNDTLWLFGGIGHDNVTMGHQLNDLWNYNITSAMF